MSVRKVRSLSADYPLELSSLIDDKTVLLTAKLKSDKAEKKNYKFVSLHSDGNLIKFIYFPRVAFKT
jgi:hypothetical protein